MNIDPPMGSVLLPMCRSNACKKTIPMLNTDPPLGSVLLPICRSNMCTKTIHMLNIDPPWGRFCYPYVVLTRVKSNTNVEYWSAHGSSFVTHVSSQCVWKTIQMLNIDPPMGSVLLPRCRSNACKIQCKHCFFNLFWRAVRHQFGTKGTFLSYVRLCETQLLDTQLF